MAFLRKAQRYSVWRASQFLRELRKGRHGASLGAFLLGGLLFQDKLTLNQIFWCGPLRISMLAWTATALLIVQVSFRVRDWWEQLLRPFRSGGAARLKDWKVPPNWDIFDEGFEIVLAPSIREPRTSGVPGWRTDEIYLRDVGDFPLPPRLGPVCEAWRSTVKPEKLSKDGIKYVLVNTPSSLSDQHNLSLELRRTWWSTVTPIKQYITDRAEGRRRLFSLIDPLWRQGRKPRILFERAELPTSLCLHAIVLTSDKRVLAVQRPTEDVTDYHPLAWSISFEEQLTDQDFVSQDGATMSPREVPAKWLRRAVAQEVLGFDQVDKFFVSTEARFMSLAFEEEIGNAFLTVYVRLSCHSAELPVYLVKAPDRGEVCSFHFIDLSTSFDEVEEILKRDRHQDGNEYHPTSKYRLRLLVELLSARRLGP